MSYEAAVLWSICRSLLVALASVILSSVLVRWRSVQQHRRDSHTHIFQTISSNLSTLFLMVPFFMPGLVVGYAYRNASLSLVQTPAWNEGLYVLIVICQLLPVMVLALEWLPPASLGESARHCLTFASRMSPPSPLVTRRWSPRRLMVGELPRRLTAGTIAALLSFQEVEVATLMQARGWPEWIFNKQVGGVELVGVASFLVSPILYGLCLTIPVIFYWRTAWNRDTPTHADHLETLRPQRGDAWISRLSAGILGISWLVTVIWPVVSLAIGALRGARVIELRSAIWREIGDGLVLALTVAGILSGILWGISRRRGSANRGGTIGNSLSFGPRVSHIFTFVIIGLFVCPGLLGSLVLALAIFEICQQMGVSPAYSPIPLVFGMTLFLLPRALALAAVWQHAERQTGVHLAQALSQASQSRGFWGRAILWRIRDLGRFWTLALLFWWAYLELTLPSLLRPAGMAPAPMRLYNFLHYGHIPGLAAMLTLVLATPILLVTVAYCVQSWRFRTAT